ncbi:MAG: ABC transporter ATP-binding protein [Thaumarchaeota archaeon]|nr:ABC transporter ATP-binding protein [Candidatus Calditenuaceae archaeon]MDW8042095.1 ABC transporter ATP-binding protein [Nitrososphaerota archaeon]MDW8043501.1 ABC transporter ATP-binding protein [Nitrososphaerota archaeon]
MSDLTELVISNLTAGYEDIPIVKSVDLQVDKGKVTLIIGPNGSGKSTLLNAVFGLARVFEGQVVLNGREVTHLDPSERVRLGLRFVMQRRSIFPHLTVEENLRMGAWTVRNDKTRMTSELAKVYDLFPILKELRSVKANLLSGGQARILELARGVMGDARVLLLDEPTTGLSPKLAKQIYDYVLKLRQMGYTILLVEQNVKSGLSVADDVLVMRTGSPIYYGSANEISVKMTEIVSSWLKY